MLRIPYCCCVVCTPRSRSALSLFFGVVRTAAPLGGQDSPARPGDSRLLGLLLMQCAAHSQGSFQPDEQDHGISDPYLACLKAKPTHTSPQEPPESFISTRRNYSLPNNFSSISSQSTVERKKATHETLIAAQQISEPKHHQPQKPITIASIDTSLTIGRGPVP
ncbi:hypothetical protein BT67DRAFT_148911 [Trichocladium antarcticum]|uniref:Uncharacterized protein n=1 Tax=Trichocladium antarcticum TaxID=1450529 RepID=A0AAN6UEW0_9PEZI|nr:hypothetical protein BT67DRAFT_148911 [Trichocladium antarcticum]